MKDRIPVKPNRYAVYDDDHNFIRYEYHERADEPTQVGDALNKANLLPDDVAVALGLDPANNPQVKDALLKVKDASDLAETKAVIETGSYTGTGTYGISNPTSFTFANVVPEFVYIMLKDAPTYNTALMHISGGGGTVNASNPAQQFLRVSIVGKKISWYTSNADAQNQLNSNNGVYHIIGIGMGV